MAEFLRLAPPYQARMSLLSRMSEVSSSLPEESIPLELALGRVLSQPILATHPLPTFSRSSVDGYAVRAQETYGASNSLPVYLQLCPKEVPMGAAPDFTIPSGACAVIHTGGMIPDGADAVVMIEHTSMAGPNTVEVMHPAAIGENVIFEGEDVKQGEIVIPSGKLLRPVELGGLAALGIVNVNVFRKPRVAILSTGDEVVPATQEIQPGQVRDVNTYTLSALVQENGGQPLTHPIVPDKVEALENAARQALAQADMLLITAGSSASARDLTSGVINNLGKPGVLAHGVNVRPGKPTILGICDGKPVIGLPGNPVSAFVIAKLFVEPAIKMLLHNIEPLSTLSLDAEIEGHGNSWSISAKLTTNLSSQAGRDDWIAVKLERGSGGFLAEPVFTKSNLIFGLVRADGLIHIPSSATGLSAGSEVSVYQF
jgi:molybdopterin molybdotransferase